MTQTYLAMFRQAAIAWSDVLLDLDTRYTSARTRILEGKAYKTKHLMRDALATWMSGWQVWEKTWMPTAGRAGVPIVFLRGPNFDVGGARSTVKKLELYASTCGSSVETGWIPRSGDHADQQSERHPEGPDHTPGSGGSTRGPLPRARHVDEAARRRCRPRSSSSRAKHD
jgi:hypothetical protein